MNIEQKIEHQTIVAKTALNNKNRISALSALRSRKLAEQNLKQRLDTLAQLEEVYSKIEQAADQVEIVRVMEASAGVLRGLHAQVGGLEKVEDIVDELREEMSKVDEIGNVINATGPDIDEAAIDEELEAMEIRERQAKEEQEAELTQQRLKELDRAERATDMAASVKATEEPNAESELDASIGKLSDMSIVDGSEVEERPEKEGPVLLLADST
jgi:charged multivesicular body protein 7